ncbi:MAG: hypothetical protein HY319_07455 [Armatimonadetes bacterium]|nr:hypothetical protein [Armatimonadota bacterium]
MPSAISKPPGSVCRAFSLLELVVYCALLLLLLGGIYLLVTSGMRYLQLGTAYESVQQQSQVGVRKMVDEVGNSSRAALFFDAVPTSHLILLSADRPLPDQDPWTYASGQLQYRKWVCFYWNQAERTLVRSELDAGGLFTDPTAPPRPGLAALQAAPSRVLAREISGLIFSFGATNQFVRIQISAEEDTASDRVTRVTLATEVQLQNL